MSQTLQAIRGMNDILPADAELWEQFEEAVRDWLRAYGYRPIRMPMVEPTPLFARAIGEVTDIVEKEMYSFEDALNGESLTLRPEGTASCVRAVLQHNLLYDGPKRLWYMGPMFRHERPQKGRYRQFHQVGVEALTWGLMVFVSKSIRSVKARSVRAIVLRCWPISNSTMSNWTLMHSAGCTATPCASWTPRIPRCRLWSTQRQS